MAYRDESAGSASDSATGTHSTTPRGAVTPSLTQGSAPHAPLPMRAGHLPMQDVIDLYMAHYAGRDTTRLQRLGWWQQKLSGLALQDLSDDQVHAALEDLTQQPARYYAGDDAEGKPIYKAKRKAISPATINRYAASLAAVITKTKTKSSLPDAGVNAAITKVRLHIYKRPCCTECGPRYQPLSGAPFDRRGRNAAAC